MNKRFSKMSRSGGFSLIELMIALVLGLLVTGALIQVFLANKLTYTVSDGLVRAQESARYAMLRLNRDLRMAASGPMCSGAPVELNNIIEIDNDGDVGDIIQAGGFIAYDYNGTDSGTYPFPLDGSGNDNANQWANFETTGLPPAIDGRVLPGTDVLGMVTMQPIAHDMTGCSNNNANQASLGVCDDNDDSISSHGVDQGTIMAAVDCTAGVGDVFVNVNNASASSFSRGSGNIHTGVSNQNNVNWSTPYQENTEFYRSDVTYYYIGQSAGSTPDRFRPALFRVRNCNGGNNCVHEELAEGVENMQVFLRTNGNNTLHDPRDNAIGNWSNVSAVELDLVLVSPEPVDNRDLEQSLELGNGLTVEMEDRRIRVAYSNTVAVRNRITVR